MIVSTTSPKKMKSSSIYEIMSLVSNVHMSKTNINSGVQKCNRGICCITKDLRVHKRFFLHFMHMNAVWQSLYVRS